MPTVRSALTRAAAGATAMIALAGAPLAAQINIVGSTQACFGLGCVAFSSSIIDANGTTFDFAGSNFSTSLATPASVAAGVQLGTLSASTSTANSGAFGADQFTLRLAFTSPAGAPNTSIFADVLGTVNNSNGNTVATFTFDPAVISFTGGSFAIAIAPVTLSPNGQGASGTSTANITATFSTLQQTTSTVPEPATVALLGTGLLGLVGSSVLRRRR